MTRFTPARAILLALWTSALAVAQVPGPESFVRPPSNPVEIWERVDYLVRTGQARAAVPFLRQFEAANPDDATLLAVRDQYGDESVLRLLDDASTRPFADRINRRLTDARRRAATNPAHVGSLIDSLTKTPGERRYAITGLREAGAYAVPPVLKATAAEGLAPEARSAIIDGLGALGDVALAPLVAGLDGPPVAEAAATALGAFGDRRALPDLTLVAERGTGSVKDAARRAVARITGTPYEAQPRTPARFLTHAAWSAHRAALDRPDDPATAWAWDEAVGTVVPRETTRRVFASDEGLKLAKGAVALAPGDREAQAALLSLAIDRDPKAAGPVALSTGPVVLEDVVRRAIAEGRNTLAADAIRALGKVTDRKGFGQGTRPGVLVEALTAPDRRVQFAAAEAIVGLEPERAFSGSSLVVPTLARFVNPAPLPRAVVIDGNPTRGSQVVGFLKVIGYDAQLALTGPDGFRLAAEMADVELLAIDPTFVQGSWRLHDTLANLKADARTAGIPIFLVGPLSLADEFAGKLDGLRDLRFLVSPTETTLFKNQVDRGLAASGAMPLSSAERLDLATRASVLLAQVATKPGHPLAPDLAAAGPALAIALSSPATAPSALRALAEVPKAESQRDLADTLIDPSRPPALRRLAAEGLARSVRRFGPLLAPDQEVKLVAALDRETDPDLKTAIATVVGALKPRPASVSRRLQAFRPTSVAR